MIYLLLSPLVRLLQFFLFSFTEWAFWILNKLHTMFRLLMIILSVLNKWVKIWFCYKLQKNFVFLGQKLGQSYQTLRKFINFLRKKSWSFALKLLCFFINSSIYIKKKTKGKIIWIYCNLKKFFGCNTEVDILVFLRSKNDCRKVVISVLR